MIDIHSHILPAMDDGSRSIEESLQMARMAVESGVKAVTATPHCVDDRIDEIQESIYYLKEALEEFHIPLKLYMGMEIFGTESTAELLQKGELCTLNSSRYPLIEFDFDSDGEEETDILQDVIQAGFRPIVAHPERYLYVQHDPYLINEWYDMGCLFQINRGSLLGRFGRGSKNIAMQLIERGFATVVASDAHYINTRTLWMADVEQFLIEEFSVETAKVLLRKNPRKLLNNEELPFGRPKWFI